MGRIEKTVFISYRRTNFYTALAVYQYLTANGYDAFFDYQSIDSGNFATAIIENIGARAHFVLVLSSSALERCNQPNDWLRREIETAIELKRNIVPLMMEGFDFGSPSTIQALSGNLSTLNTYNGLRLYSDYFFDTMEKLRTRFLNVAIDDLSSREVTAETKETNETKKTLADEAPQVKVQQITAEEWFERGYSFTENKNFDEAIRCYSKAIELSSSPEDIYNNRGLAYCEKGDLELALNDFNNAILINPRDPDFFGNIGYAIIENDGNLEQAIQALNKAIKLSPKNAIYYNNRGRIYYRKQKYKKAFSDFDLAIKLDPKIPHPYSNRANIRHINNDLDGAISDYNEAIRLNPQESVFYFNLGNILNQLKRYSEAESAYRKSIDLNPLYIPPLTDLTALLRRTNKIKETIPLLKKIIEIDPQDFNSYLAIASIDKQAGREMSKEHTENARQFMPEDDWYNRACLESVCDNFDMAFENLEKAAMLEKFNPVWAWEDPDLQWIRDDPRFIQIVGPKPE